jgi:hypothetical protein
MRKKQGWNEDLGRKAADTAKKPFSTVTESNANLARSHFETDTGGGGLGAGEGVEGSCQTLTGPQPCSPHSAEQNRVITDAVT